MREYGFPPQHPDAPKDPQGWLGAKLGKFFSKKPEASAVEAPQVIERPDSSFEDLRRLEEIGRQLEALGIRDQEIAMLIERGTSLSTSIELVYEYVKLYLRSLGKKPVVEVSIGKNFSNDQALEQLGSVVQALPDERPQDSALLRFHNRIEGGKVALAISIDPDVDGNNRQMNDFANNTRGYQQHERGFVVVYAKSSEVFDKGDLIEMAINARTINQRKK